MTIYLFIDTLGVLARCVGAEMFQPLTKESIQFGLNLLNTAEDPDQRRCMYVTFDTFNDTFN